MTSVAATKRIHVLYSGRVQGVGFRYTVCREAESFEVTGFVRNLWDGNVELVAEGRESELMDFLQAIRCSNLSRYIVKEQVGWEPSTGKYKTFGITV